MSDAPPTQTCPKCGTLSVAVLEGFCPKCAAAFAFGSGADAPLGPRQIAPQFQNIDDHELLEEIARGGMGVVFKARQISLNRTVAIKTILAGLYSNDTEMQRFRAEAQAAARLQHPNIVAIHVVGECNGLPYFSMDYVEGQPLTELVRAGPLDAMRAAGYLKTIAEAIAYAHQSGILHRDLKPSNVMIDRFDQPRVTDFGLAKSLEEDRELTRTGQILGSPGFISPEQAGGRNDLVGPQSDVYSLGAILYFLLTARPPFLGKTLEETLSKMFHHEPIPPRRLNPAVASDLETICLKCLEKDASRRYASAHGLAMELDRFLRDEPILARPVGRTEKAWRWLRRHPASASLATSLVITLTAPLAVAALLTNGRSRPLAAMPSRSGNGVSSIIGRKIYMTIPNKGDGSGIHDFYSFDPANNVWSHALDTIPKVHNTPAGGVIADKFYVAGGVNEKGVIIDRLDIYNHTSDAWSSVGGAAMPVPVVGASSTVWDGKLYVLGGSADQHASTNLVQIYDPRTDHWVFGPVLRQSRGGAGAAVMGRNLYLVGGYSEDTPERLVRDLEALGQTEHGLFWRRCHSLWYFHSSALVKGFCMSQVAAPKPLQKTLCRPTRPRPASGQCWHGCQPRGTMVAALNASMANSIFLADGPICRRIISLCTTRHAISGANKKQGTSYISCNSCVRFLL